MFHMYSRVSIVIVLCVFIFTGCSFFPGEIKTAERLIETAPDSALQILRNVNYDKSLSAAERANYGLLLFEALDKTYQPLKPDSVLNFSIDYYKRKRNSEKLAKWYFYKRRSYNYAFQYENASRVHMLALDNLKGSKDYNLLAKIYSDLGDICSIQNEFEESREKYKTSEEFLLRINKMKESLYKKIDIGNTFRNQNDLKKSHEIYMEVLLKSSDSLLSGVALQEIGVNYFRENKYDSSVFYLKESLKYPFIEFNMSVRLYMLSDAYYELNILDSALIYSNKSLQYPANFYTKRECYRILANTSYLKGDYRKMANYMKHYQSYTDSVRQIEIQTKSTIIENIHQTSEKVSKSKRSMWISISMLPLLFLVGLLIYVRLRNRSKGAEVELEEKLEKLVEYEKKLHVNHEQLKNNLLFKIEEVRKRDKNKSKKLTLHEKLESDRKVFEECLYIDDSQAFDKLMNFTFNNVLNKLNNLNSELSRNELMCCCLLLLDLNSQEITLILGVQINTFYKLKQRLVQKLNLNSSSDIMPFLRNLWTR